MEMDRQQISLFLRHFCWLIDRVVC